MADKEYIVKEIEKLLVAEYRQNHPEATAYTDTEIAMMNPVSELDIELYLSIQLMLLQKEIAFCQNEYLENNEKISAKDTFPEERSELRSENVSLMRKIKMLESQMITINQELGDYRDASRSR